MLSLFNTGYGLQNQLDGVKNGIAIVSTGDTHIAITSGQYVYIQDHGTLAEGLYKATSNIAANATLSGSNVTAVSGGGLNALNSNLTQYVAINNSDNMQAKLTSAFTTISGKNLPIDRSYPVMLSFSGANFSGSFTGTFNLTSGGIRFLIGDENHLIEGLFLRSTNTISSVNDLNSASTSIISFLSTDKYKPLEGTSVYLAQRGNIVTITGTVQVVSREGAFPGAKVASGMPIPLNPNGMYADISTNGYFGLKETMRVYITTSGDLCLRYGESDYTYAFTVTYCI